MPSPRIALALGVLLSALASADASRAAAQEDSGFDRSAASSALSSVDLAKCKSPKAARGEGHVLVRFAPSGSASEAVVDKGPMVGTPVAKCIAGQYKKAKVPAFKGQPVQVGKTFHFD